MNKEEARKLIKELVNEPEICTECGKGVLEESIGETGYSIWSCSKCGYSYSEE